jgi:hypothetical protein
VRRSLRRVVDMNPRASVYARPACALGAAVRARVRRDGAAAGARRMRARA